MDNNDIDSIAMMQLAVNKVVYDTIAECYEKASMEMDQPNAIGIVVSALATNLGIIFAQLPDNARQHYVDSGRRIIDESLLSAMETMSIDTWGVVGHA